LTTMALTECFRCRCYSYS